MNLTLRKATIDDMDMLYKWANDAEVRKNAFNSEHIPYEDHIKWFNNIMKDDTVLQLILSDKTAPIGQLRLNIEDDKAYIDYSISPDKRGFGIGKAMISLLIKKLSDSDNICNNVKTLVGQVKYENPASARVFEKCGFTRYDKAEYIEYCLTMER
jgi:RimJ/RimL family protein N-acetyltransferase